MRGFPLRQILDCWPKVNQYIFGLVLGEGLPGSRSILGETRPVVMLSPLPMPTAAYWAVPCQTCGAMIALALIEFGLNKQTIQPLLVDAFEAGCILCRSINSYSSHEVVAWEGPLPAPNFRPHPAF